MSKPKDLVIFRRWNNGDLIALFPEIPADHSGINCLSYERIGEHGGADCSGVIRRTEPANLKDKDVFELAKHLMRRGYNLQSIFRCTQKHDEVRRAAAMAIR